MLSLSQSHVCPTCQFSSWRAFKIRTASKSDFIDVVSNTQIATLHLFCLRTIWMIIIKPKPRGEQVFLLVPILTPFWQTTKTFQVTKSNQDRIHSIWENCTATLHHYTKTCFLFALLEFTRKKLCLIIPLSIEHRGERKETFHPIIDSSM